MIRLVQKKLIIPRGDTGSFSIPTLSTFANSDVAVFSIIDQKTNTILLSSICTENNGVLTVTFDHNSTVNLPVGRYHWDIKYYKDPEYQEGKLINGIEVDSYYAAYQLPVCEIRQTGDALLTFTQSSDDVVGSNVINIINMKINQIYNRVREMVNSATAAINTKSNEELEAIRNQGIAIRDTIPSDYTTLSNNVNNLRKTLQAYGHSTNWLNPGQILTNTQINTSGAEETYSGRNSSGWIPAAYGDILYLTGINSDGAMIALTGVSILRVAMYDANKTLLGQVVWQQSYTIPYQDTAYVRITYSNSGALAAAKYLALMFTQPQSFRDIQPYHEEGYAVIDQIIKSGSTRVIPDNFVDAWGDSRIQNGSGTTSIDKYLADMLGANRVNHGYSGQGSGQIALRMGANECYVTLENNKITNGDNTITYVWVNHGASNINLMQNANAATSGVLCNIAGVEGYFWNYAGQPKFTPRYTLYEDVPTIPRTKVFVSKSMYYRYIIIWAGKNDFSNYTEEGFHEYLADTVSAMANIIPHNQFIILGETASSIASYQYGGAARTVMDKYNKIMARRYPDNFIDIQAELSQHGLEMADITPSEDDEYALSVGLLPPSLMSDTIHQNPTCRLVIAKIIYQFMKDKKWID